MKPDWKDAPDWANWLAQDQCGAWFWYAKKPRYEGSVWGNGGQFTRASEDRVAEDTLEERPK